MRRSAITIMILAGVLAGCGPVGATSRISDAEGAMERARVADAQVHAPYEYYMAAYFLHKAKEEWGYSDFEASRDYASEAKRSAEAALLKAKEDPWTGSPVPEDKRREAMQQTSAPLNMNRRPTMQVKEQAKTQQPEQTPAPVKAQPKKPAEREMDILDNPNMD